MRVCVCAEDIQEICVTLITKKTIEVWFEQQKQGSLMSKKKKESGPMPAASAGLLRFFEEETEGVKIRPELLVVFSVALMVLSVLAQVFFPI